MKIGIITVYDAMNNLGSYLQGYALKGFLEEQGHQVYFLENVPKLYHIKKTILKINPKREFFLRIKKCVKFLKALKQFKTIKKQDIEKENFDCLIYGSDEIWNMDNKYFKDPFFFGTDNGHQNKIAYAMSIGEMKKETLDENIDVAKGIFDFKCIYVRDDHTKKVLEDTLGTELKTVCDPTLLIPVEKLAKPIKPPKEKYIFVYTYGIDPPMIENIKRFAKEKGLKIVSACFWHIWCDKIVQCEPLQFSTLIKNAEYVFTTTFHGAIFTMLNHKNCCILPIRYKVKDVVKSLGVGEHLLEDDCSYETFCEKIEKPFPEEAFKERLSALRKTSQELLKEVLND
ncbi:MAG: polysaccharide pyruvyl transferase family protein [Clostridia bacterium]|nr:polysaccharide pyruvyl transferase family protein [Clostridia bacterium]